MSASSDKMNGACDDQGHAAVLTKTVIQSPVVRWLLHARVRSKDFNDAVFIGDDFVHVRQILPGGHLKHITTKDNFDARIRAAAVLDLEPQFSEDDLLVKTEDRSRIPGNDVPQDLLVLTLSTNDLVFLYVASDAAGNACFVQQPCPLPSFDRILFQPGEYLAIDAESRALVVASNEREVVIYSMKDRQRIRREIQDRSSTWCPIIAERQIQAPGVIQCVDFLTSPDADPTHINLLLIVLDDQIRKAVRIDWYATSDLRQANMHPALPMSAERTVPSLLIPLRNASFLVITGSEGVRYRDIRSGSLTDAMPVSLKLEAQHLGGSPRFPLWTNWCRPARTPATRREKDHIYLVREDGLVVLLEASSNGMMSATSAGHLQCHAGTAFASFGRDADPDVLAVAGEMCPGRIVSIGHWPSNGVGRIHDLGWMDTMTPEKIEIIPNWASATDLCITSLPRSHGRSLRARDGIFMTSGRQPYGSVTELRYGLETQLSLVVELEDISVLSGMWIVPMGSSGTWVFILATPNGTKCLELAVDDDIELRLPEPDALDLDHRTLIVAPTLEGGIIQVTEFEICETLTLHANFEDTIKRPRASGTSISAATIDTNNQRVIMANNLGGDASLSYLQLPLSELEGEDAASMSLPSAALSLASIDHGVSSIVIASTAEHGISVYVIDRQSIGEPTALYTARSQDVSYLCDHIVLLRSENLARTLAVCGLRGGQVLSIMFEVTGGGTVQVVGQYEFRAGNSPVRLAALPDNPMQAYMCVGYDTCLLTWDGADATSLSINNILISNKDEPELAQNEVGACAQLPTSDVLKSTDLAGSMAMLSDGKLLIGHISDSPRAVPRQLPLEGTPNRLLYSEEQRCLVVASMRTGVRTFTISNGRTETRRQIWPSIDFIPARANEPSYTYDMQPGERVYSLLEWSYKVTGPEKEKTYSFILVGGSYQKRNGTQGGRVTFLQPGSTNWEITSVTEGTATRFDAPVYALAQFDELTYAVCYGRNIALYRFSPEQRRWSELCSLALAHLGVHMTASAPMIHISSSEDSLIALRLHEEHEDEQGNIVPELIPFGAGPRAEKSLHHLILPSNNDHGETTQRTALLTTQRRSIVGLSVKHPTPTVQTSPLGSTILFAADLPRSLTRIKHASLRPPWKLTPPRGVLNAEIIGVASDGTIIGIAILNAALYRRLSWLQRLCEWSPLLSPHSHHMPPYSANERGFAGEERAMPIGLTRDAATAKEEISLRTLVAREVDRHIDGDLLQRLLTHGGAECLRRLIRGVAEEETQAGVWTRRNLEAELGCVEEVVGLVKGVLDCWM
ncbi:hypothetical protein LTR62_004315 [Meristemomyces frigidus]|uniref:RSE1/DDB1/CPSF1 first beta-propeller domain-containing protein n=1 Tax=Meristemomyces frigidus TaxID=1508187 RepID=A0AAN7YK23_9PEZI|nr:hypothetical protein LTR62_004315 [Meristemomyces frigidus]